MQKLCQKPERETGFLMRNTGFYSEFLAENRFLKLVQDLDLNNAELKSALRTLQLKNSPFFAI